MFSPGETVGHYVIEEHLGAGGFGEVFRATDRSLERQVALKFVRPEYAGDPAFVRRFQHEVVAMARVEHPNVVAIYAHAPVEGHQCFAMRYVPGGSLDKLLPSLGFEDVVDVLDGVAAGLDACHARGVIHRDLKPANVLVEADTGRGLLADFGIAVTPELSTLTAPGQTPGTRAYMAPETLLGGPATAKSDLWALAAVAYRAACGALPRGHGQAPDAPVVAPSRRVERFGRGVDRVLLRALSFDPALRCESGCAFVSELREALVHDVSPTHRMATRRWWSVAGAAFVLTPMVALGIAALDSSPTCHPSYTGACLKVDAGDYDCKNGSGDGPNYVSRPIRVVGPDEFGLDRDGDGAAC